MSVLIFRSQAAGEIVMMGDAAQHLLTLIGKPMSERGVIAVDQLADAIDCLNRAVERESGSATAKKNDRDPATESPVGLAQRAFPLLGMLRAAQAAGACVTWGV